MKKLSSIFILFSLSFFLFSCGSPNSKFISEVEKLEEIVRKAGESIAVIDTSKIGNYYRISNENLKFIQENYKDTMDRETAFLLSDYAASRKSMKKFQENYSDVVKEISYSKTQLRNFKTDLENNAMEENKFSDYYSAESKGAERLNELAQNLVVWYDSAIKTHETKSPEAEKFVEKLKGADSLK